MLEQNIKSHPGVAAVLSFIFSGLGQLYNGQLKKGLLIILFSVLSIFIIIIASLLIAMWMLGKVIFGWQLALGLVLFFISLLLICVLAIYSIIDAYQTAAKK
jgi:hypothetical protein